MKFRLIKRILLAIVAICFLVVGAFAFWLLFQVDQAEASGGFIQACSQSAHPDCTRLDRRDLLATGLLSSIFGLLLLSFCRR